MELAALEESFHEETIPDSAGPSQYMCDVCGKGYHTKCGLSKHMVRKHDAAQSKRVQCQICKVTFTTKGHLEGHINSHHNLKPHVCTLCNSKYSYRSALLRHISTQHSESTIATAKDGSATAAREHKCDICLQVFTRKDILTDHVKGKHSMGHSYRCEKCGLSFKWRGSLCRHRLSKGHLRK